MRISNVEISWLGHDGFRITDVLDNRVIYIDPYQIKDGAPADIILVTHSHYDHCSIEDIKKVSTPKTVILAPADCQSKFQGKVDFRDVVLMEPGKDVTMGNINVEAVPAVHGINPLVALFAGGVNGYWVTIQNKKEHLSVYITSDTVSHRKVRRMLQGRQVDLLIPNMGAVKKGSWMGTLTLSAKMLHDIMSIIQPKLCIPVHFGTFEHYVESISEVEQWQDKNIVILKPGQTYTGVL